jgi:hypothetical protein
MNHPPAGYPQRKFGVLPGDAPDVPSSVTSVTRTTGHAQRCIAAPTATSSD